MTQNTTDGGPDSIAPHRETAPLDRYEAIEFDGRAVLIYDDESADARIQLDA